ncbi:MAG TPA: glycosyltransferase family 2 protein [Burkholderiaceae bacterium]|nr:glycosyltransferase family 2 protein [Burkholderiaceae bacterium]
MPPITIVVVAYQSAATLPALFDAARACHEAGLVGRVVVVDNASTDATATLLAAQPAWVHAIHAPHNLGFGRGCNLGAEQVETKYTLLLNPDASIGAEALRTMLEFMQAHPRAGVVGPATLCGRDADAPVLQPTGPLPTAGSIAYAALRNAASGGLRPIVPGSTPFVTGWVCGAVFLIRTALYRQLGGFDPRFFLYWEETDLCRRVAATGHQVWALGSATAHHIAAASSADDATRIAGCIGRHYYQSRRHYLIKHDGWLAATAAELVEWAALCARTAADVLRGRGAARIRPRRQARLLTRPAAPLSPQGQGKNARSC